MRAVVLVGGEGTRLRPLTYSTPKQMLPIVEVPMIVRVLDGLARHGVDTAVLSLGYRPDAFIEAFPESVAAGVRLEYVVEEEPLDTAGAVRFAATEIGIDETFLVLNGDVLTDFDITGLVGLHRDRSAACTIALTPVADPSRFGIVVTDEAGLVREFVEKPAPGTEPSNLANAGIYVVEPHVVERIPGGRRVSIERETFPALAAERSLYGLASDAYWLDTGTPAQYLAAQLDIVAGRRPTVALPPCEEIEPGVFVAAGASVAGSLEAPCYVGAAASVAAGALVARSIISAGVAVGPNAAVLGSVVLDGACLAEGCRVEASVVGPSAVVGERAQVCGGSVVGRAAQVPAAAELLGQRFPA